MFVSEKKKTDADTHIEDFEAASNRKQVHQVRNRNPTVKNMLMNTNFSGMIGVDLDSAEMPDDELSRIVEPHIKAVGKSRNFMTYCGGPESLRSEL